MIIVITLVSCTSRHKAVIVIVLFVIYVVVTSATGIRSTNGNGPFSNSLQRLFQSEFEWEVLVMNISFHSFRRHNSLPQQKIGTYSRFEQETEGSSIMIGPLVRNSKNTQPFLKISTTIFTCIKQCFRNSCH